MIAFGFVSHGPFWAFPGPFKSPRYFHPKNLNPIQNTAQLCVRHPLTEPMVPTLDFDSEAANRLNVTILLPEKGKDDREIYHGANTGGCLNQEH